MSNTLGPELSWRLIHDGTNVLMLSETSGITETIHHAFESQTQRECTIEAKRLNLVPPEDINELFVLEEVPQSISMRQAELALLDAGLLDDIEALIPNLPRADQISWKRASVVERNNPLVAYVQQANNLTDTQIDTLFIEAAKL